MQEADKEMIYRAVSLQLNEWYGEELKHKGACLYWMQLTLIALRRLGLRALPQAGTMHWRFVPPEMDDGKCAMWFGYEWSPENDLSKFAIQHGLVPEIHCWIGLPDTNEIVDFSTRYVQEQAEREGYRWLAPVPPDYIWCQADQLPDGVFYKPEIDAINFTLRFIAEKFTQPKGQAA